MFEGGLRRAQTAQARAAYDATVASYRQTVLTGFQEVEDNLASLRILEEEAQVQDEAVKASQESVTMTTNQYRSGTVSYLNVIVAQTIALNSERTALDILGRRMQPPSSLSKPLAAAGMRPPCNRPMTLVAAMTSIRSLPGATPCQQIGEVLITSQVVFASVAGVDMDQYRRGRNIKTLWAVVLFGITYSSLLYYQGTLTGANNVDGIIGVLFGLYICLHPAANLVDMLFFGRSARRQFPSKRSAVLWLAFNMLVLLIGWIVIFVGTTRFIGLKSGGIWSFEIPVTSDVEKAGLKGLYVPSKELKELEQQRKQKGEKGI